MAEVPTSILLMATCVSLPRPLVLLDGRQIYSGIDKRPVSESVIVLTPTGLAGDQQVETQLKASGRQLHGGPDKAVYAYPIEHLSAWSKDLSQTLRSGSFGENLSIRGALETDVQVGDIWGWGDASLQVVSPRQPCHKLAAHRQRADISRLMKANGRCGWYMRVLTPGGVVVPTTGTIEVVERVADAPTVAEVFAQKVRRNSIA